MKTNKHAAFDFVEYGLAEKRLGNRESASGPGSSMASTAEIRSFIIDTVKKFNIATLLDLGCGDWHWMQKVFDSPELSGVAYEGWDIHDGLIDELRSRYGNERITFRVADIVQTELPAVDLIVCRDVLFHLENDLVAVVLDHIKLSGSKYFISTTFPDETENAGLRKYLPIEDWGFRRINLDIEPFNMKTCLIDRVLEPLNSNNGSARYVSLYRIPT